MIYLVMQVKKEILDKLGLSPGTCALIWIALISSEGFISLILIEVSFFNFQKRVSGGQKILLPFFQKGACRLLVKVSTPMKPLLSHL